MEILLITHSSCYVLIIKYRSNMLTKQITFDHSITELGQIQIRRIIRILEDSKEISKTYHRHIINPGDNISNQDDRSKLLASVLWTPDVISDYKSVLVEIAKETIDAIHTLNR